MRWTVEQDAVIRREWPAGADPADIAAKLGLSVYAVIDRALHMNLAPVRRQRRESRVTAPALGLSAIPPWRHCHFIEGDPVRLLRAGKTPFCGRPSMAGSSFCPEHHKLCHKPLDPAELERLAETAAGAEKARSRTALSR